MIALFTDPHFGTKNFAKNIFETQMEFFEKQLFPYLLKHDIKDAICLGDLVHNRNIIDLWILQELKQRFFKWFDDNGVKLHCIIGNHDIYYKNTAQYNFLSENVNEFKNILVYNETTIIELEKYRIGMVPWVINEDNLELPDKVDILCGHFDIVGIPMLKNIYSTEGLKTNVLEKYKIVFSGHYHIRSRTQNIHYIGTPYQLSWADFDEPKGFCVLQDNFNIKYIENTTTSKFVKIYYNESENGVQLKASGVKQGKVVEISGNDAVKLAKNNYVKLITSKVTNQSELDNIYNSVTLVSKNNYKIEVINSNEIIESFDFDEIESDIEQDSDLFVTISSYISGMRFDENIDKDFLVDLIKGLYKESLEEQVDI